MQVKCVYAGRLHRVNDLTVCVWYARASPRLLQSSFQISPPVHPVRLVERHLGRPEYRAIHGLDAEHELR